MLGKEGSCQLVDFMTVELVPIWNRCLHSVLLGQDLGLELPELRVQGLVFERPWGNREIVELNFARPGRDEPSMPQLTSLLCERLCLLLRKYSPAE